MGVRWCGIDFGETIMNPFTLHQSGIIRQIYAELGRPEEAEGRVQRWYRLRGSVGSPGDPPEKRVRHLKQYARQRIYAEVLDENPEAIRLFEKKESEGFSPAPGVKSALDLLKASGTTLAIVSEVTETAAALAIMRFLRAHGLSDYFEEIVAPAGRLNQMSELVGPEFVGKTKREGTLYDKLLDYLGRLGIDPSDAAIVGDDPVLDIANAKQRGFVTVQYTGVVNRGPSPVTDYVMDDWSKFPTQILGRSP